MSIRISLCEFILAISRNPFDWLYFLSRKNPTIASYALCEAIYIGRWDNDVFF